MAIRYFFQNNAALIGNLQNLNVKVTIHILKQAHELDYFLAGSRNFLDSPMISWKTVWNIFPNIKCELLTSDLIFTVT